MTASPTTPTTPTRPATPRRVFWPGVAGVASGVLMLVAVLVTYDNSPDYGGEDGLRNTVAFYRDVGNRDLTEAMTLVMLVAALLFLWFLAGLAKLAGSRSYLVLVGGTTFTVLLMIATIAGAIYAISASNTEAFQVGPGTAMVAMLLLDVSYAGLIAAMAGAAVLLFAVWRVSQVTGDVPPWLGWTGFVIAVLCLAGPFSAWLTVLLMAAWTLLTGLLLVMRPPVP
jgi:hypothetical protein